jgi:hypothetical protein
VPIAVHEHREQPVGDLGKPAALRKRDQRPAPLRPLGGVRPRAGVEQRQARDALRRFEQHRERDVAAHRQPGEREARRRRREDARRDGVHGLIVAVVRDGHRPESPERRNLLGIEPRRAIQPGDEDDRQRLGHGPSIFVPAQEKLGIIGSYCVAAGLTFSHFRLCSAQHGSIVHSTVSPRAKLPSLSGNPARIGSGRF